MEIKDPSEFPSEFRMFTQNKYTIKKKNTKWDNEFALIQYLQIYIILSELPRSVFGVAINKQTNKRLHRVK